MTRKDAVRLIEAAVPAKQRTVRRMVRRAAGKVYDELTRAPTPPDCSHRGGVCRKCIDL